MYLNSRKEWLWARSEKALWINGNAKHEYEITQEERFLANSILKYISGRWKKPSFKKASLIVGDDCELLESPNKTKHFGYWIRLYTKEKRKPIHLPVKPHDYFHAREGKLTELIQISEDGKIRLAKEVALDFKMGCLFATDRDEPLGRNLQRQKMKPKQSNRLSEHVKSEVRRILNRVVELYRPARLVVENLKYFVKRVLIGLWLGEIKRKLRELQEECGIQVLYVNPAYTSQTCSSCGYVDKENRKSGSEFECKCCGKFFHANVNASINLFGQVGDASTGRGASLHY